MKKTMLFIIIQFLVTLHLFAVITGLPFVPESFEDDEYSIYQFGWMEQIETIENSSQSYDFAFGDINSRFEIRYTMFAQTEERNNIKDQIDMWSWMVMVNIAGSEDAIQGVSVFKEDDVRSEFNADYGFTTTVPGKISDFTDAYDYIMINFYYKDGIGIMCQTILFNDLDLFNDEDFFQTFHSFKFN